MLNYGYLVYQAERTKTQPEQRETDAQLGQLSAAFAQLLRLLTKPARLAPPARYGPAGSPAAALASSSASATCTSSSAV
jgi:hypothetical protein